MEVITEITLDDDKVLDLSSVKDTLNKWSERKGDSTIHLLSEQFYHPPCIIFFADHSDKSRLSDFCAIVFDYPDSIRSGSQVRVGFVLKNFQALQLASEISNYFDGK